VGLPLGVLAGGLLTTPGAEWRVLAASLGVQALAVAVAWRALPRDEVPAPVSPGGAAWRGPRALLLAGFNFVVSFTALGVALTLITVGPAPGGPADGGAGARATALMVAVILSMAAATVAVSRRVTSEASLPLALLLRSWGDGVAVSVAAVVGLGGACGALSACATSLLGHWSPGARLGSANGWSQAAGDLGGALGPLVAAAALERLGLDGAWRACAGVTVLLSAALLALGAVVRVARPALAQAPFET
jgi:MFS family permease